MASTTATQAPFSLFLGTQNGCGRRRKRHLLIRKAPSGRTGNGGSGFGVYAEQGSPAKPQRAPPGVDTRIHWDNDDEGWVGGRSTDSEQTKQAEDEQKNMLGKKFADLLNDSSDSHYQFLGVSADADMEEIKTAYRRLSKEYHPDTTSLPLKAASDKFMRLREVYDILSNDEKRRFYDWTLAQEAASRQAEKMRMRLEDPYEQETKQI
ncbi:putative proteinD(P)H-QUINONE OXIDOREDUCTASE SUBUNIT T CHLOROPLASTIC [Salix purpurea]|uniref:J domain-containing protein n=1 Tax=Salix purpurea TaxID=77065 RepID=A0A9Q0WEC2_SALPP|nr:putative proteinD(P)H-QUINONE OXIDOREDUCTASE SUBUNIT T CHLOROPLASTIC [Salix purpurea]